MNDRGYRICGCNDGRPSPPAEDFEKHFSEAECEMESTHPLKALLQLQLATDSSAVLHLPYIIASLTSDCFLPSSHLTKWTTRINSLLYSKDAGGRWAGLCIAQKTSDLSRETMIEYAQSWLGVALPMLSVGIYSLQIFRSLTMHSLDRKMNRCPRSRLLYAS